MISKAIGVDIGGTKTAVALINENLQIEHKKTFPSSGNMEKAVRRIKNEINAIDGEKKLPAGIAVCGMLSMDGEMLITAPNLEWYNVDTKKLFGPLERKFRVINDANAAAWASYNGEKKPSTTRLLALTLGTGVGGGLVIDGRILLGAAEMGHLKTELNGAGCTCGGAGCLETVAGGHCIPQRAGEWENLDVESAEELFNLAEKNDEKAIRVWDKIGRLTGYYLGGAVNMTGVSEIILGGRITAAGKYFIPQLRKELKLSIMAGGERKCPVKVSKYGRDHSLIGAGAVVLNPEICDVPAHTA